MGPSFKTLPSCLLLMHKRCVSKLTMLNKYPCLIKQNMKFFDSVAMLNARWLCKLAMVHLLLPQLLCLEFGHLVRNHKAYNLVQSTMCRPIALVFVENKML